jgi:hypothetical protein
LPEVWLTKDFERYRLIDYFCWRNFSSQDAFLLRVWHSFSVTGASRLPAEGARPLLLIKALYPGRRRKTHFETAQQGGAVYAMG